MKTRQNFTTSDLYLATYLELNNIPITFETINGRVIVTAESSRVLNDLLSQYHNDAPVPILTYTTKLRQLRARIYMHRTA